jgi:hypothetical protein
VTEEWWACRRWGHTTPLECDNPNCNRGHEVDEDGNSLGRCGNYCEDGYIPTDTDDPNCPCSMCQARRWDRLPAKDREKNPGLRPHPTVRA